MGDSFIQSGKSRVSGAKTRYKVDKNKDTELTKPLLSCASRSYPKLSCCTAVLGCYYKQNVFCLTEEDAAVLFCTL